MVFKIDIIYNEYTCMSVSGTGMAQLVHVEWPGLESQQGKEFFSTPQHPDQLLGPPSLLSNGHLGLFPWWLKQQGCDTDHSLPSSGKVPIHIHGSVLN
jgi:hypothetical protein